MLTSLLSPSVQASNTLLYQYGQACRGDWSKPAARWIQDFIDDVLELQVLNTNQESLDEQVLELRARYGLCLEGDGIWAAWCDHPACSEA